MYIDLDTEFDGLLGSDFLALYNCIMEYNKKELIIDFKTIAVLKVPDQNSITKSDTPNKYLISILSQ